MSYNIYCDESCHLENDKQKSMVLGAIWCYKPKTKEINKKIRQIKENHGVPGYIEIKWTKVSKSKLGLYRELISYFFENENLHFRALVIPDKIILNHRKYKQTHDDWYYKMYFNMLKTIILPKSSNYIYLDIKDTQSAHKVKKLQRILSNSMYDFNLEIIKRIQNIRSEESQIIQVADLLIGAVSYVNRNLSGSSSKLELIKMIREKSGYSLNKSTLISEKKINILVWSGSDF